MSKKTTATLIPHPSDARDSAALRAMRLRLHAAGYGLYWMIIERLGASTDFYCTRDYDMLAYELHADRAMVKSIIEDFGLFIFSDDGSSFSSQIFVAIQAARARNSLRASVAARARWSSRPATPSSVTAAPSSSAVSVSSVTAAPSSVTAAPSSVTVSVSSAPGRSASPSGLHPDYQPLCGPDDNQKCLTRFFDPSNNDQLKQLCKNFGLTPDDTNVINDEALSIVNSWNLSSVRHNDYSDWAKHLISTLRIRLADRPSPKREQTTPSTPADYAFNGGFGSID